MNVGMNVGMDGRCAGRISAPAKNEGVGEHVRVKAHSSEGCREVEIQSPHRPKNVSFEEPSLYRTVDESIAALPRSDRLT